MNFSISQATYDEVEDLVNKALTASSKAAAKKYIDRLDAIWHFGDYFGYINSVFSDLLASVSRASGSVADKERLCYFAKQDLYKLEGQMEKKDGAC